MKTVFIPDCQRQPRQDGIRAETAPSTSTRSPRGQPKNDKIKKVVMKMTSNLEIFKYIKVKV